MEINALFDLWDKFSEAMKTQTTDVINQQFYTFPPGTKQSEIIEWFQQQNPFFAVSHSIVDHRLCYVAFCEPAKQESEA